MPFLLGSFTDGLFGGIGDVTKIANDWETLKQHRMETKRQQDLMDAGAKARQAVETDQATTGAAQSPTGQTLTNQTGATPPPYEAPDLNSVPQPKFMADKVIREALKPPPSYLADTKGRYREGAGLPSSAVNASPAQQPAASDNGDYTSPTGLIGGAVGSVFRAGLAAGRAMTGQSDTHGQPGNPATADIPPPPSQNNFSPPGTTFAIPTTPPNYLAPGAAGQSGSTWALPPGPQSAVPSGRPSLASSQMGLGSRIMAALNPTAGAA